jgi:hypothetical protein
VIFKILSHLLGAGRPQFVELDIEGYKSFKVHSDTVSRVASLHSELENRARYCRGVEAETSKAFS